MTDTPTTDDAEQLSHEQLSHEQLSREQEWDARYQESDRIWSGNPNDALLRETAGLAPGRALDLGCGEGADAIWLAEQGWHVTATDVSGVALVRGAEEARSRGLADRIDWQRHDLGESFPAGEFDLVVSFFLHNYQDFPREAILRTAAAAVTVGGVLLIVGHSAGPAGHDHHPEITLPGPDEVLASLQLAAGAWDVLVAGEHERVKAGPDGEMLEWTDNAVKVRRLS